MDAAESMPVGDILHARIHVSLLKRIGWNVLVQYDVEEGDQVRRVTERYSRLSRGELISVVDAIRDQLNLPLSEYA